MWKRILLHLYWETSWRIRVRMSVLPYQPRFEKKEYNSLCKLGRLQCPFLTECTDRTSSWWALQVRESCGRNCVSTLFLSSSSISSRWIEVITPPELHMNTWSPTSEGMLHMPKSTLILGRPRARIPMCNASIRPLRLGNCKGELQHSSFIAPFSQSEQLQALCDLFPWPLHTRGRIAAFRTRQCRISYIKWGEAHYYGKLSSF